MNKHTMVSNQWSIGIGIRRTEAYDTNRWMLWVNYGFKSTSWSWKRNPKPPHTKE